MLNALNPNDNASTLAQAIRRLARDAHALLNGPDAEEHAVEALIARIDRVRQSEAARDREPIVRWLESLRREVEAAYLPVGPA